MSGSLSAIASGLQDIGQMLGGGVIIGGVRLQDFEVPEQVNFGGTQIVVQHKLVGGMRHVDAMGPDEADIGWHGIMLGANAYLRARLLDEMRIAGEQITLLFGPFTRDVVISEFSADYKRQNWIGSYSVKCVVIPPQTFASEPGLVDGVLGDIGDALGFDASDMAAVSSTLSAAQTTVAALGNFLPGTSAAGSALTALSGVSSALTAAQSLADGTLGAAVSSIASTGNTGGSAAFGTALAAAKDMAAAVGASAYVGRAVTNLTGATA